MAHTTEQVERRRGPEPPDLAEKGGNKNGVPQRSNDRLFMQLLVFGGCADAQPLAAALEQRVASEGAYEQCIKAGVLAMYKGFSPMVSVEFARRVLPDEVRPTFDETEQLCKGTRNDAATAAAA
jgi:hypothetical protein